MMGGHLLYTHDGLWSVFELELPAFAAQASVDAELAQPSALSA
jgi:hypothetical protein